MITIHDVIIKDTFSIADALKRLDILQSQAMTLLVIDNRGCMLGTLTDGDIRRALIAGKKIESSVTEAMCDKYACLRDGKDIRTVKYLRESGIALIPVVDESNHITDIIDLTALKSRLPIDAVLMAGGKGERLRPLTLTTPKPLLKVGDKTIIDRNIDRLSEFGIHHVSVTVNYLKDQLIEHYIDPRPSGVKVDCVSERQFFGTIGALKLVKKFKNDTILVMNSDLLTDIDYEDFYLHFKEHDAMMAAAGIPYTISVPYGIFKLEGREIKGVAEKPVYNYYANAGIYLLKKEALDYIPENVIFNATDLIETLVRNSQKVIRYPLTGLWIDIGTPEEFRKAQELIRHLKL